MTDDDITAAVAELDGWERQHDTMFVFKGPDGAEISHKRLDEFKYLASRDAIIPVIARQTEQVKGWIANTVYKQRNCIPFSEAVDGRYTDKVVGDLITAFPYQLCIALVKACEKWKD